MNLRVKRVLRRGERRALFCNRNFCSDGSVIVAWRGMIEASILMEDGSMKLQKVLAGVVVAALALTSAPVGNVYADEGEIPIDEAHFPDESFRSWVSENCDTDGDGSLADWEIMMTTGIDVEREGINTLKGIEYFTALRELYCYNNQLTTLDVSKNTALTDLYCYFNELTTLDVSKNTALSTLCCKDNYFTQVDVSAQDLSVFVYYDGTLDKENKILYVEPRGEDPSDPVKTISVGDKVTFKTKKKIARVEVINEAAVSVKKKGKKVIVTGKSAGKALVRALKKGKELGSWVVKVE